LKTAISLHYYNGGTIAKHSNFSLQRVILSSSHVTRNFRHRDEVWGMVVQQALGKDVYMAKNDATVLVTFVKNVAEKAKRFYLFKPRYKMAHKPRYSFVVSVASGKDYIVTVLITVAG